MSMKEQNQESETITISKEKYDEMVNSVELLDALMNVGVENWKGWWVAHEDMIFNQGVYKVGMNIGVQLWDKQYGNGAVIDKGKIVSIDDKFVKIINDDKKVSSYQIGHYNFFDVE